VVVPIFPLPPPPLPREMQFDGVNLSRVPHIANGGVNLSRAEQALCKSKDYFNLKKRNV